LPISNVKAQPIVIYWRETQYLEAASVPAFRELAAALEQHRAPADLVARALSAAEEEVEHARLCALELARFDVAPSSVVRRDTQAPSLFDLARDNAREGCVRESFAALLAQYQAHRAATAELRALFSQIAQDEANHAQLAWDIHAWVTGALSDQEVEALRDEMSESLRSLVSDEARLGVEDAAALREVGLGDVAGRARLALDFAGSIRRAALA
jgi:hypothetical protein